jgi:hypothetical protein
MRTTRPDDASGDERPVQDLPGSVALHGPTGAPLTGEELVSLSCLERYSHPPATPARPVRHDPFPEERGRFPGGEPHWDPQPRRRLPSH